MMSNEPNQILHIPILWCRPTIGGKSHLSLPLATQMDRLHEQNELETRQQ